MNDLYREAFKRYLLAVGDAAVETHKLKGLTPWYRPFRKYVLTVVSTMLFSIYTTGTELLANLKKMEKLEEADSNDRQTYS